MERLPDGARVVADLHEMLDPDVEALEGLAHHQLLVDGASLGGELAWTSPTIIGLVIGSVLALAMFVRAETRAAEPILPMRLFRNPVFTMCCVLSLVVGFAMLGALTFMPTFMQFVDGVSPSESGLRTMPMVIGLLITSTVSGSLVGRTGRYKIYPVAGTAIMLVGFVLLSRMNAATPIPMQSLYLFILGAGIGMCMQVLVLIVQNTSDFTDLGVATSGVTFFRKFNIWLLNSSKVLTSVKFWNKLVGLDPPLEPLLVFPMVFR